MRSNHPGIIIDTSALNIFSNEIQYRLSGQSLNRDMAALLLYAIITFTPLVVNRALDAMT